MQDWNSNILSFMRAPDGNVNTALETLSFMKERFCITEHLAMPCFDFTKESVASFCIRRDASFSRLREVLPKSVKVSAASVALLDEGLCDCYQLDRLLLSKKERILCIQLPLSANTDVLDREINHLLYKGKYRLFFASFDLSLLLYPKEFTERLMRIRGALYQFNYRALAETKACDAIKTLLDCRATVLLGSSVTSADKLWHYDFPYFIDCARAYFTDKEQRMLFQTRSLSSL